MRSVGTNISIVFDRIGTPYQIAVDGEVILSAYNSTGWADIAPVLRDYLNSSHIDIGSIGVEGGGSFAVNPYTAFQNRQFVLVEVDQTRSPVAVNVSTQIPADLSYDPYDINRFLVTNDYNWRSETTVPDVLRLTSRIVGGRADSRQFLFISAKSLTPGITICKTYGAAGQDSTCHSYASMQALEGFRISNIACPSTMRIQVSPSGSTTEYDGQDVRILCGCRQKYAIYAVNRDGGVTTCLFDGRSMESAGFSAFDIETNSLQPNYPTTRLTNRISTEGRRQWRLNSGKLLNEDADDMVDIATSPRIWLHDLETDRMFSVNCTDSQVDKKRRINTPGEVINYTMTFEEARVNIRR